MTSVLLDTHAWVWWLTRPEKLSRGQRAAIERAQKSARSTLLVSIISCWEIAALVERGKFRFSLPVEIWLDQATTTPGLSLVPLSLPIVCTAARLGSLRDPADMMIVATAQHHGAKLVTSDSRIQETGLVPFVG